MSKCLTRLFHYVVIPYILFPELRKYISFTLAHYSLGNCFSSIILTAWILTAPDSVGEAPTVSASTFLPWDSRLSPIMSFLEQTFYLGLFLPFPMEAGCQDTICNADPEGLPKPGLPSPLQQGNNALLYRLTKISIAELVLPIPVLM